MQHSFNPVHGAFLQQEARYYYSMGGRWSAKTYEVLAENIEDAFNLSELRVTITRKVYASIKTSIFNDILLVMKDMGLIENIHYKKTTSPLFIKFIQSGSEFLFMGADSTEKTKGIAGSHRLVMEECNEFQEMDFETLDMSMRGKGYPLKTYLMHNPVPIITGGLYWFQRLFDPGNLKPGVPRLFNREGLGRVCSLKSTYQHNKYCPEATAKRLEGYKTTNPVLYKLWALGEYAEVKGKVFNNYDIVDTVPDSIDFLGYGLDFGYAEDPVALLKVWANSTDIYIQGKIYTVGLLNDDLIKRMKLEGVDDFDLVVADSSEPKTIDDLYKKGVYGIKGVRKRPGYKEDTVNILKNYTIHLLSDSIDLQREFSTYAWRRDKNDNITPKLQDGNDHYIDCLVMFWSNKLEAKASMLDAL